MWNLKAKFNTFKNKVIKEGKWQVTDNANDL